MRIPTICFTCLNERIAGKRPWKSDERPSLLELRDDGAYLGTCANGHEVAFAVQVLRYEMLYEAAAVALVCGFYREAISTMSTALERYYEFATAVIAERRGVSAEEFAKGWKVVSSSSQRQLGAFLFLYLTEFGKPYAGSNQKMTELRNDVVHKGAIPSREQAVLFAEYVFDTIVDGREELHEHAGKALKAVQARLLAVHSVSLARRQQTERGKDHPVRKGGAWRVSSMLRDWADWREGGEHPRGFTWNLEALAYRVQISGAGLVVYPQTYTEFDPHEGEHDEQEEDDWEEPPSPEDLVEDPSEPN